MFIIIINYYRSHFGSRKLLFLIQKTQLRIFLQIFCEMFSFSTPIFSQDKYKGTNEYINNLNFNFHHVIVRVFEGEKSNHINSDFQLGFHCKSSISHLVGSECRDCWYSKRKGYGCCAVISYDDFYEFVENSNITEFIIKNSFTKSNIARILKTEINNVFIIFLLTCKNSLLEDNNPYPYLLTTIKVSEFVSKRRIFLLQNYNITNPSHVKNYCIIKNKNKSNNNYKIVINVTDDDDDTNKITNTATTISLNVKTHTTASSVENNISLYNIYL